MASDPRKLTADALRSIERDASDYARELKQPRRLIRRLLDHIDAITETLERMKQP